MVIKLEAGVVVIKSNLLTKLQIILLLLPVSVYTRGNGIQSNSVYKKRVLESAEIDLLSSYYTQDGKNAAVSGGIGTEHLTDTNPTIVISIPLNDDDVLTIDVGISAFTSASASNINPLDGNIADPFQASSGASSSDIQTSIAGIYNHSSDDRNDIWSAKLSMSTEYDYFSLGIGGSYTKLFNRKNTEINVTTNLYLDNWYPLYPYELGGSGGEDGEYFNFNNYLITGNTNYNPSFTPLDKTRRNSFSVGFTFSQVITKRLQTSLALDLVQQQGLLSTPFQRVYFSDIADTFIENFQLADDIERLPSSRFKVAIGDRFNYYINDIFIARTYYRYYFDNWGIKSHTAMIEIPVKFSDKFTLYPSFRYFKQTPAKYFAPYEQHLSTEKFYTSDYDLSDFSAHQYGFGVTYNDIFTGFHLWRFGLKSIDLKFNLYKRDSGLKVFMIAGGFKFVMD